jgi:hypothetical protein
MTHFAFEEAPAGQRKATCVYSGQVYSYTPPFAWYTATPFSREHTWCVSWTPSNATASFNEYCDQHHLFPTNQNDANAVRSNHPLGDVVTVISSYLEGTYGLDANGNNVYEPRDSQKGDAARALLYMSMRYNGVNGFDWTLDHLNNNILTALGEDPQSVELLLQWHQQDLPDNYEIARNDYIQSIQQNRNPFIDHPEWVNHINFSNLTWLDLNAGMQTDQSNVAADFETEFAYKPDLHIYPNPASELANVQITAPTDGVADMRVYDMTGKLIMDRNVVLNTGNNLFELNTNDLAVGTYLIMVNGNQINESLRLMIQ